MNHPLKKKITDYLRSRRNEILKDKVIILAESERDVSISSDKKLHKSLVKFLASVSEYPILSEEDEKPKDISSYKDYVWILDPLDGSMNFLRNIPLACISLGLWHNQKPIAGFIYDFHRDEMFTGFCKKSFLSDKTGAWLNDKPIRVSPVSDKGRGILCLNFPSLGRYDNKSLSAFVKKIREWKKIRLLGSAAISLAWVACGRFEAYIEEGIRIWDIAAGVAIIKAAGGEYITYDHKPNNILTVSATNRIIPCTKLS